MTITSPGPLDLLIRQGTTFRREFALTNEDGSVIDLSGHSARMEVRTAHRSPDVLVDWTDQLTIDGEAGSITFTLTAEMTSALEFRGAVYDMEIEGAAGEVTRLLEGRVTISPEVTR